MGSATTMGSAPALPAASDPADAGLPPPVDLAHLTRYTLGERKLEREVLALFRSQSSICLERLRAAASEENWREAAHSLKGSALAIGAWRAAEAADRAEQLSGPAFVEERDDCLRLVDASLREANDYIRTLF